VHDLYFNPQHEEFAPRTMWALSNAFTSAFKELDPIPQFRATAKLGPFLEARAVRKFRRHFSPTSGRVYSTAFLFPRSQPQRLAYLSGSGVDCRIAINSSRSFITSGLVDSSIKTTSDYLVASAGPKG